MFFSIPSFTKLLILVCVVVISWKGLTWLQKRQENTTHKKTFRDTIIEKMIKKMQKDSDIAQQSSQYNDAITLTECPKCGLMRSETSTTCTCENSSFH